MKKEIMTRLLSIIVSIAMSVGCFSIISTADEYEKYQPCAEAQQLINATYQKLGLSEFKITSMSRTSLPVNEVYAFVTAANVPAGAAIVVNTNYRNDFLSYDAYKNGSYCGTNTPIFGSAPGSYQSYILCNYSSLLSGSGSMIIVRFTPNNPIYGYSYIVNNVYSNALLSNPLVVVNTTGSTVETDVSVPGDVNLDGYLDDTDSTLMANFIVGNSAVPFTDNMVRSCDVNHDGNPDSTDLTILIEYLAGLRSHLIDLS